jgi:hypothetical protein
MTRSKKVSIAKSTQEASDDEDNSKSKTTQQNLAGGDYDEHSSHFRELDPRMPPNDRD